MQVPVSNLSPPNTTNNLGVSREVDNKSNEDSKVDFQSMISGKKDKVSTLQISELEPRKNRAYNEGLVRDRNPPRVRDRNPRELEPETTTKAMKKKSSSTETKSVDRSDSRVEESKHQNPRKASRAKETKNSAVQKLMASLESEFGISAERFSAALAQLPSEVKTMSIENSAPFVMNELGVPAEQQMEATEAYVNLLNQAGLTESNQKKQTFNTSLNTESGGIEIPQELMSDNAESQAMNANTLNSSLTKRQKLNATIDAMNRKFFDIQQERANQSLQSKQANLTLLSEENQNKNNDSALSPMAQQRSSELLKPDFNLDSTASTDYKSFPKNKGNFDIKELDGLDTEDPFAALAEEENLSALGALTESNFDLQSLPRSTSSLDINSLAASSRNAFPSKFVSSQTMPQSQQQLQSLGAEVFQPALAQERGVNFSSLRDLEEMLSPENSLQYSDVSAGKELSENSRMWSVEELPFLAQQDNNGFSTFSKNSNTGSFEEGMGSFQEQSLGNGGLDKLAKGSDTKERESIDELINEFNMSSEPGQKITNSATSTNKMSSVNDVLLTPQERVDNLQRLSNATESLAARGGGEVKVVLAPEGLGTIQLKVSVVEGKVQVEMKTENKDSQRALESSLSELKHSLASHNLSIDSVKVDVGSDFSQRESSQSFSQQQPDLGRDQARQFINQFRDQNLFQRQSFFEAPGFKNYRSQNEEPMTPIAQEVRPRSSLNSNKGRDLNVIV